MISFVRWTRTTIYLLRSAFTNLAITNTDSNRCLATFLYLIPCKTDTQQSKEPCVRLAGFNNQNQLSLVCRKLNPLIKHIPLSKEKVLKQYSLTSTGLFQYSCLFPLKTMIHHGGRGEHEGEKLRLFSSCTSCPSW